MMSSSENDSEYTEYAEVKETIKSKAQSVKLTRSMRGMVKKGAADRSDEPLLELYTSSDEECEDPNPSSSTTAQAQSEIDETFEPALATSIRKYKLFKAILDQVLTKAAIEGIDWSIVSKQFSGATPQAVRSIFNSLRRISNEGDVDLAQQPKWISGRPVVTQDNIILMRVLDQISLGGISQRARGQGAINWSAVADAFDAGSATKVRKRFHEMRIELQKKGLIPKLAAFTAKESDMAEDTDAELHMSPTNSYAETNRHIHLLLAMVDDLSGGQERPTIKWMDLASRLGYTEDYVPQQTFRRLWENYLKIEVEVQKTPLEKIDEWSAYTESFDDEFDDEEPLPPYKELDSQEDGAIVIGDSVDGDSGVDTADG